ncbi:hypothetical protein ID866_5371 [Astraeus odoratus]|nr:hypothetical protein ID866_5371 [Astraeus odoratus]
MTKRPGHGYSSSEPTFLQSIGGNSKSSPYYDEEAVRISQKIDEELKKDWARQKECQRRQVKGAQSAARPLAVHILTHSSVMLLGQAESGKSTLQKQFQLYYAHQTLDHERPLWRPVVYFNIIKAVRMILDELDHELSNLDSDQSTEGQAVAHALAPLGDVSGEISRLRTKLVPLTSMEDSLASELSDGISVSGGRTGVFVRAGWQALVAPLSPNRSKAAPATGGLLPAVAHVTNLASRTLMSVQSEIDDLWKHPAVRILLNNRRIRLDESAPFFLDNLKRIAQPDYLPTTADLLNVRLQTLGISEHSFDIELCGTRYNWLMYDVGGARGQASTCAYRIRPDGQLTSYFHYVSNIRGTHGSRTLTMVRHISLAAVCYLNLETACMVEFSLTSVLPSATAIIFLAPISAFDQYLEEDGRTNRLDDSLQLFTAICSNKLLKNSHLVLLLNKTDLLKKKLESGIKVRKYITSYGDRPNAFADVSEYFRAHFIQVHRRNDIGRRALYAHFTSMLDIRATQAIIVNGVHESQIFYTLSGFSSVSSTAAMSTSGLKAISPVPTAADFLDIVLSKTQRKTPTVIHKNFKISRIRAFYMRKVKFTQDSFDEKLGAILSEFPMLDVRYIVDLHPFLASLMNVLYDKNHYKLALGQLRTARHLIDQIAKDYVRLLKFGDSLYRCKQLKTAALGRMATIMRRQKDPLAYLEQVRQHISRLPAIDPNTRTLLICGYPNVGKSSFMNKVTRADVDVQPYAFTTKSLFVGHLDYKYLRWQVIDTPGVLDHPLEEMNTIEMQSITALAHLKSCILYFMDLSEQCGYTVEAQCKLFHSIKPLFSGKPTILVINKIDVTRLEDLSEENRALVQEIVDAEDVQCIQVSCYSDEGVIELKNKACDALLAHRVETKLKGSKVNAIANRVHVAQPVPRDNIERPPFIPDVVRERKKFDKNDPDRKKLLRDVEAEEGGPGVYSINLKTKYLLANPDWKMDIMPEILDGKNIADFVDPDIAEKLEALEREEEQLQVEGYYDTDEDIFDSEDEREAVQMQKSNEFKLQSQIIKKAQKNQARLPRTAGLRTLSELTSSLKKAGYDPSSIQQRAAMLAKVQGAKRKRADADMDVDMDSENEAGSGAEDDWMDVDDEETPNKRAKTNSGAVIAKTSRAARSNRQLAGLRDEQLQQASKATKLRNLGQRRRNMLAKAGESDRAIRVKMPKHLFAGKRKAGKTDRR